MERLYRFNTAISSILGFLLGLFVALAGETVFGDGDRLFPKGSNFKKVKEEAVYGWRLSKN